MIRRLVCGALLFALLRCSDHDTLHFETLAYTLAPGDEKYLCYTMTLPADHETVVTAFRPVYGKLVHHFVLAHTKVPEPEGVSECAVRFKDSWVPLFEVGRASGPLVLPAGTAMRFRGQQLVLQVHLVNSTSSPVTERSAVDLETVDPSTKTVNAGIFGFDNRAISIPPRSSIDASMSCAVSRDMHVFAVLGHMHDRGRRLELTRRGEVVYATDWSSDVQPTTALALDVKKGDPFGLKCSWTNPGDTTVVYGEKSTDEMCSLIWYYTPFEALDGCGNP